MQQAEVVPHVGEGVARRVPQHVRPDVSEAAPLARFLDHVVDCLANHLLSALGDEEPWQLVPARREVALDRSELVTWSGCSLSSEPFTQTLASLRLI